MFSLGISYFPSALNKKTHAELNKVVIYPCCGKWDPGAFVNWLSIVFLSTSFFLVIERIAFQFIAVRQKGVNIKH